jgi:oligopeptide/dipeptide ABC transporter ATP-binding protein
VSGTAPLLDVRGLKAEFRMHDVTVHAVDGVSFALEGGERLGIVGESGSGKSVTALSVMRMVRRPGHIVAGEVLFHGEDLLRLPEAGMRSLRGRRLAMVPQNPLSSLNPVMTIGAHLREVLAVHLDMDRRSGTEMAVDLLQQVGLPDPRGRLDEYPHRISGGQRQRVMIALAMACGPELLIADEPTTALDVTIQAQILELIDELVGSSGLASILITHNLGIVAGHCDRVVVMYAGRIVETAPVDELFAHACHPYTAGLLRCVPRLTSHRRRDIYTIPGAPPRVTEPVPGCPFAPRCERATDECRERMPPIEPAGPGHGVACWHPVGEAAA